MGARVPAVQEEVPPQVPAAAARPPQARHVGRRPLPLRPLRDTLPLPVAEGGARVRRPHRPGQGINTCMLHNKYGIIYESKMDQANMSYSSRFTLMMCIICGHYSIMSRNGNVMYCNE